MKTITFDEAELVLARQTFERAIRDTYQVATAVEFDDEERERAKQTAATRKMEALAALGAKFS